MTPEQDITPDWVALDWGTRHLKAWAMQGGSVIAQLQSDAGMGSLHQEEFDATLSALFSVWNVTSTVPIVACGMVGARQGWVEAPFCAVPCPPLATDLKRVPGTALNMHIIPGLRQVTPADVMRGEETQIAGFLALNPTWDGVICLPGAHTKWAHISAGEVVSFQTYMTGEVFGLLSRHSVLRHSVEGEGWHDSAFDNAVEEALTRPEKLAARLFSIHADDVLDNTPSDVSRARLSGLLIGAELAASKPYWLGTNIAILGAHSPTQYYARALQTQGAAATIADAERMTLAGLTAAYRQLKDSK